MLVYVFPILIIIIKLIESILPSPRIEDIKKSYIAPPKLIEHFNGGFKIQVADSLWIRAIQDFDFCSEVKPSSEQTLKGQPPECVGKSWLFNVLDVATTLDPHFDAGVYQSGGLALTVIISDYAGASVIFDRGTRLYPTSWTLLYSAAYHAHIEEKNKAKAARLYLAAAENGAPSWIKLMAGRLAGEGGDMDYAEQILQTMIETNQDATYIEILKNKLETLRVQIKSKTK